MNTILLVDDDEYVINGLLKHIPWEDMGVHIIGTAADGAEGLAKYRELKPDFIITDVYMPIMDGFQLTEEIHKLNPNVPIVILSGYDDLMNARKAVSSGVHHFLLKPPSTTEIEFVVREVVQLLNESNEQEQLLTSYLQQQEVVQRSMKAAFFRDLITTRYRPEELPHSRIAFMGLPERTIVRALTLSLVRPDVSVRREERDWQLLRFGTGNIIREMLEGNLPRRPGLTAEVLEYSDQEFVVLFLEDPDRGFENSGLSFITSLSNEMLDNILQYMKLSVLAGLGTGKAGYEQLIDTYLESRVAVEVAEMNEWNRVYTYSAVAKSDGSNNLSMDDVRLLHDAIFQKQWQRAEELWNIVRMELACSGVSLPVCRGICSGIASSLWTVLHSTDPQKEPSEMRLEELLVQLNRCGSVRRMTEWMDEIVSRLLMQIREEHSSKKSHVLVDKVIRDHIEKCYHEDITLERIAESLHVNRNYLSQLFKRVTGEPFVTYFNKFRIRKAIELIETGNYMVYEVSERVGFQNSTYFSQVFKSITGCSPSEYKRQ
ncbi:helix-turn-helix protein [Paenibacillus cellulosilyticus]|uniref:Helix-turn-helix protein n=1 Tax=Paenibacillus cellulosilyticus TaxID=375489 RepID=A0A2V2YZV5_9BACL|nr:response regulator [Paenibacillus cellulosilyticus]PWV99504.1 helix-turn-helix protein [Paenibacillus cellulosilyticus]QKS44757.1 response regulator [Paenibacillus cellulosilyticus]